MSTNFPQAIAPDDFDPFNSASNPTLPAFELWGMVEIQAWGCHLQKGVGKVPFNPQDPTHKRFTAIDLFIQPLPELNIINTKTCEAHMLGESKEWASITLASIKTLGVDNVREINGKFAHVTKVPNGTTYTNKVGETKEGLTFKFMEFFDDEEKCRAAYFAAGGQPIAPKMTSFNPETAPAPVVPAAQAAEVEKQTALQFLRVIVPAAARGKTSLEEATQSVAVTLAQYPTVNKWFTTESPEALELIAQVVVKA